MAFAASPLTPDLDTVDSEAWRRMRDQVVAAATAALPQIPHPETLTVGEPVGDATTVTLPANPGAAITGLLAGAADGTVLLVVGQELVEALSGTPFGDLEPAKALQPALESVAASLGGRLEGEAVSTPVDDCLTVLTGSTTVLIPLLAGDTVAAMLAVSLATQASDATTASAARSWGIDMLRDVAMEVTCELGRTHMTVRQLLALAPGDVVELDRLAGAPADLLVNGTLLARGEVVVIDESFGLRITEIVSKDAS